MKGEIERGEQVNFKDITKKGVWKFGGKFYNLFY
jgi:hypothetical protein